MYHGVDIAQRIGDALLVANVSLNEFSVVVEVAGCSVGVDLRSQIVENPNTIPTLQ
jgi:hypothetical protein